MLESITFENSSKDPLSIGHTQKIWKVGVKGALQFNLITDVTSFDFELNPPQELQL
jgi:hypothetical protein